MTPPLGSWILLLGGLDPPLGRWVLLLGGSDPPPRWRRRRWAAAAAAVAVKKKREKKGRGLRARAEGEGRGRDTIVCDWIVCDCILHLACRPPVLRLETAPCAPFWGEFGRGAPAPDPPPR